MAQPYDGPISEIPAHDGATVRRLDLTAADASIALAAGLYSLHLTGTIVGIARVGAAAADPASGAAAVPGFVLAPGAETMLHLQADATVHALLVSVGNEVLRLTRLRSPA